MGIADVSGRPGRATRPKAPAFTMVEMLVVITILAILIGLAAGVTQFVMNELDKRRTGAILSILMSAVDRYRELESDYPDSLEDLKDNSESLTILKDLPEGSYGGGDEFLDSFGRELRYLKSGGLGGKPVVQSRGPDGAFDTDDDIFSDGRGA